MVDPLELDHPTAFASVLRWMGRPGYAVRDLLHGNARGAEHQLLDFASEPIRALIPGDQGSLGTSRPEDYTEASDLFGGMEPGIGRTVVDTLGGIASDPFSYLSFGAAGGIRAGLPFAKGTTIAGTEGRKLDPLSLAAEGYGHLKSQLPESAQKTVGDFERGVRSTFGAQRVSPQVESALSAGQSAGSAVSRAENTFLTDLLKGVPERERKALGEIGHNLRLDPATGRPVGLIDPTEAEDIAQRAERYLAGNKEVDAESVRRLASEIGGFSKRQFAAGASRGFGGNVFTERSGGVSDYFPRQFSGVRERDQALDELTGSHTMKGRKLEKASDVLDFMGNPENAGVSLEFDAAKALAQRAQQSGSLAKKAAIGKSIVGENFTLADEKSRAELTSFMDGLAKTDPESHQVLKDAFEGIGPRGAVLGGLAKLNKAFKPFAVYGAVIPRMGSIIRNRISAVPQLAATPGAEGAAKKLANPLSAASDVAGGVQQALHEVMGISMPGDELSKSLQKIEAAFRRSGGVAAKAADILVQEGDHRLAEAIHHGVLDSFVSSEQLVKDIGGSKARQWFQMPGKAFQGVEERMRVGAFLHLLSEGQDAGRAARLTKDALYDYSVSSKANRTLRDLIPFGQFSAKAIPQQAKLLSRTPALAVGLGELYGQRSDSPTPEWIANQTSIPLGYNDKGEREYAVGLGLPWEALNAIPNATGSGLNDLGSQIKSNVIGQAQPLLKSMWSVTSGEDPYFGSKPGSYTKVPLFGEQGEAGGNYNLLAGTGTIQPVDSFLRTLDGITKDQPLGIKLLDQLSGAKIAAVDEDRALQELLTKSLENNPNIQQYSGLYSKSKDQDTMALLDELSQTKKRIKDHRKAAASGGLFQ